MIRYLLIIILYFFSHQIKANDVQEALNMVAKAELASKSNLWPNVRHDFFYNNIKANLNKTLYLNQGLGTNFCGHAVITYHLIRINPIMYTKMLLELYNTGKTTTPTGMLLTASDQIKKYAGTIKNKGRLDINHADQLWFMTLSDNFKGYINFFSGSYSPGGESSLWASTVYKTFNTMLRDITGNKVEAKGSDLIRPSIDNYYEFIQEKLKHNTVFLYLNNTVLYPRRFFNIIWPIPTHFVELCDINPIEDVYVLNYWDYGLITKVSIKKSDFRKLIYGITYSPK